MAKRTRVVVAYDIVDNKRRRLVREFLEEMGRAVNRSVFECDLTRGDAFQKLNGQSGVSIFYPVFHQNRSLIHGQTAQKGREL